MGFKEIEQAISQLSADELTRFRRWYEEFDAEVWDEQFEQDARNGKLDKLAEKAVEEYRAGNASDL